MKTAQATRSVTSVRRRGGRFAAVCALAVAVGATSLATAAIGRGEGVERFAATFEARAAAPLITPCPALGPGGEKLEGRYQGTMTIDGDQLELNFSLEALSDSSTGLGAAEGRWQLVDPRSSEVVGRGEFAGVVTLAEHPDPEHPAERELIGLLKGQVDPPDPDLPAQRLVANVQVSLGDGATFPHLKGTVGDPTGLGAHPAVLLPPVKC